MRMILCAGLAMTAGLGMASAAVAQDDDWEFQQDTARNITVAAARYDAGQMIVVQCRDGGLTAVLTGLPPSEAPLVLAATRADGRHSQQSWRPAGAPGAYQSASPGHDVRFMRSGGAYTVRTGEGAATAFRGVFDLPTQFANLDRVLTACGWATTDDRDALEEAATVITIVDPDPAPRRERQQSRSVSQRPRFSTPVPPAGPVAPPAPPPPEHQISCIVRDMHLRDCRADHLASARERDVLALIRANEGNEVYPIAGVDPAPAEGRVLRLTGGRTVMVIDYLGTVPSL